MISGCFRGQTGVSSLQFHSKTLSPGGAAEHASASGEFNKQQETHEQGNPEMKNLKTALTNQGTKTGKHTRRTEKQTGEQDKWTGKEGNNN